MDDRYTIDTPENITFGYDIAGIGSRFLAAIIDTIVIVIAEIIVFVIIGLVTANSLDTSSGLVIGLGAAFAFVMLWSYYIVFEMVWSGQSPGKRAIGLRVVRQGGQPVTFLGSAIRNLIRIVDLLPSFYGIGVVAMFIDRQARRLGDLAAGTLVVKERRSVSLESLSAIVPPAASTDAALVLPNLDLLDDKDYDLVQEFLRRRTDLSRDARMRLGGQIASGLQARLGVPQGNDPELFLQQVATEYPVFKRRQT